uniref:ALPHA-MOMORCHARIN n=1 Tax=Momordica charantia TaxID=3673 RepID=UPI00001126B7|nr:Chain A, ALPHA-MOMORCHARIN [Momordica charantia]
DVSFRLSGADPRSYGMFIKDLRNALPFREKVYNIPLLLPSVSGAGRYLLMHLFNRDGKTITVAVDVTNIYIMGYLADTTSYFFNEPAAELASQYVFRDARRKITLPYSGDYERLQIAAGKPREKIPIGLPALDSAISTLLHYDSTAAAGALLVLIQTTAEAARFKYIEQQIQERAYRDEVPSLATISLENSWSGLSKQIQLAQGNNGIFRTPIVLVDNKGNRVQITNVTSKVVTSNIQLLLNTRNIAEGDNGDVSTTHGFSSY